MKTTKNTVINVNDLTQSNLSDDDRNLFDHGRNNPHYYSKKDNKIYLEEIIELANKHKTLIDIQTRPELIYGALDILRLEKILENDGININNNVCDSISYNISLLHSNENSIKTIFATFPWEILKVINREDFQKSYNQLNADLPELYFNLKQIIRYYFKKNPEIELILSEEINQRILTYPETANNRINGLVNIRQVIEPYLDAQIKKQILALINKVQEFDINKDDSTGSFAVLSATWMIGEAAKKISVQTKLLETNTRIPFREFKNFRDEMHNLILRITSNTHLMPFIKREWKLFFNIREYIIGDLKQLFSQMDISEIVPSTSEFWRFNSTDGTKISKEQKNNIIVSINDFLDKNSIQADKKLLIDNVEKILNEKATYKKNSNLFSELINIIHHETNIEHVNIKAIFSSEVQELAKKIKIVKSTDAPIAIVNVQCFKDFQDKLWKNQIPKNQGSKKIPISDDVKVEAKLGLMLQSLEQIMISTKNLLAVHDIPLYDLRDLFLKPQFHFFHLCHLMIIGECRKNLTKIELFNTYADANILKEFEFLRWVRNALAHDDEIDHIDSTFGLFGNDLIISENIKTSGASAYDSKEYYHYMKDKVNLLLDNLLNKKNGVNIHQESVDFYIYLMLEELNKEHIAFLNKNETTDSKTLILSQLHNLGALKGLIRIDRKNNEKKEYYEVREILCKKLHLNPKVIYESKNDIYNLATDNEVTLVSIIEHDRFMPGFFSNSNLIFIVDVNSAEKLVQFKKACRKILRYKVAIVTREELIQYFKANLNSEEIDDYIVELNKYITAYNNFEKVINSIILHEIIENNETIDKVNEIIQQGCDPNFIYQLSPAIYNAYLQDRNDIIKLLIQNGANVNQPIAEENDETLIHIALKDLAIEDDEFIRGLNFILEIDKLRLIPEPVWKVSPLHLLAHEKYLREINEYKEIISKLLKYATEEELNQIDGFGKTPLLEAIEQNNIEFVKEILQYDKVDIHFARQKPVGQCAPYIPVYITPLAAAAILNYYEIVQMLLERSDIKIVFHPYIHCISIGIIDRNWPLYGKDIGFNEGSTALHMATVMGNKDILELLLKRFGIEALIKLDYNGNNLLHLACIFKHFNIVELLLSKNRLNLLFSNSLDDELFSKFVNYKNCEGNSAVFFTPDRKYLKLFLLCQAFKIHDIEAYNLKSFAQKIIKSKDGELISLLNERLDIHNAHPHHEISTDIKKNLVGFLHEDRLAGITTTGIGVDDLLHTYLTHEPLKFVGFSARSLLKFEIIIHSFSNQYTQEEINKTIEYSFEYDDLQYIFKIIPNTVNKELLSLIESNLDFNEQSYQLNITDLVNAYIKVEEDENISLISEDEFEIPYESLMTLTGLTMSD